MKSKGGLGGDLGSTWVKDMKSIINGNHTATELEQRFDGALAKYGHEAKPLSFIKRLRAKKEKICHTYMKFTFTHGHSTTQRSESGNSSIKARGELVELLESATLVGMYELVDLAIRRHKRRAVDELTDLRKKNLRYGAFYSNSLDESMRMCATRVKSCKK